MTSSDRSPKQSKENRGVAQSSSRSISPVSRRSSGFLQSVMATTTRYAPGDSPFHLKGHVYRSSMGYYGSVLPGGMAQVLEHLDAPHRAFFKQHFLTASWYDALPLFPLSVAVATARGMDHYAAMRERARVQAESDIQGVYRVILNIASPETIALRIGRAMMQYFDFGEATSRMTADRVCEVTHAGVPMPLVPLSSPLADGFILTALELAGAHDVVFGADVPERDGVVDGTPTYRLRFEIAWE